MIFGDLVRSYKEVRVIFGRFLQATAICGHFFFLGPGALSDKNTSVCVLRFVPFSAVLIRKVLREAIAEG